MHSEFAFEKEKFDSTIAYLTEYYSDIRKEKEKINEKIEVALKHYNSENIDQYNELVINTSKHSFLEQKVRDVSKSLNKPYFARVDFIPDIIEDINHHKTYIGKFTLFDESGLKVLITDWRAPISTLYYEGRVGRAGYICPDGNIEGEITLKRQYMSENGKLLDITDIDITTNDEFLQASLGSSKDKRLKDIVTTIQAEQNRIIRADMFKPLVVQGAAGSGKTTIALHRIAYLLYEHEDRLGPRNMMIMAPNKFFLSYISNVLPDLGVDYVTQTTFEEFAITFLGKKIKIVPAVKILADVIESGSDVNNMLLASSLKASLKYKKFIEKYYNYYLHKFIPEEDFDIEGYVIVNNKRIREYILKDYSYLPLAKRVDELKKNLDTALKREKEKILNFINKKYDSKRDAVKREMEDCPERRKIIIQILDERDRKLKDVTKIIKNRIKEYIASFKLFPVDRLYVSLIGNSKMFYALAEGIFDINECDTITEATRLHINAGCVDTDDIAPLMYLQNKLYGVGEAGETKHIVIDEAQDYSLFQFFVLKDVLGINSFSILGDLNQGIYSYRGVKSWKDVCEHSFNHPQYLNLEQSYRTTIEIMDKANGVIDHLNKLSNQGQTDGEISNTYEVKKAKPVIRHGSEVSIRSKPDLTQIAEEIDICIKNCTEEGYRSIAVICKTYKECSAFGKLMKTKADIINVNDSEYKGGVLLSPSYLVKGLEFDVVIIATASDENYGNNELDIKLLYISMTRALHRLYVYYCGKISPLLN